MKKKYYIKMREFFYEHPCADKAVHDASIVLTGGIYLIYTGTALYLLLKKDNRLRDYLLVPAGVFLSGSLIRDFIDEKRPYEVLDLKMYQIQGREEKRGKSMPSRHTFSAAVIAEAFRKLDPAAGTLMSAAAAAVAVLRVLSGSHWIRDVMAGLVFGTAGGRIGNNILSMNRHI